MNEAAVRVDVAVIGAGPAGLAAADTLVRSDKSVVVLEGRDRVGGRLLSIDAENGRLDLGATWFWSNESRVTDVVLAEQLDRFEQHLAGDAMFQNEQGAQRIEGNPIDAPSARLVLGTQSIAEALAARLPPEVVHLGATVRSVESADDGLRVSTEDATWLARHVVLAVPPATAVSRIDFAPALPDQVAALAAATPVWMGNIVKVVAHYQEPFWRADGLAGAAFSYVGPMREIHDMSGRDGSPAALFGFAQPGLGKPPPTEAEVRAQLTTLFGPQAAAPIRLLIQDWRAEPLTSPDNVDELNAYQTYGHSLFAEPALGGRLHWASTETAVTAPGHIEGALQAASRAAGAILATLE